MLNFAVGPVASSDSVRAIGSLDTPYLSICSLEHC